ncbi:RNA exonuclease 4 isoform X3 [Bos javanicus]|uniref:RNA exonuclease 4 isoform X3 n=1 Tax=Bos javanicus TaxID=9906 RepID=UPI002AA68A55|nr:RNA exonuclease 4 isoform X3 [Bos javanicus]
MVKARGPAAGRAPRGPAPDAGPVRKPRRKKRVWKNKAREAGGTPGVDPGAVAVRPPKAPEDFSPNWKALQEASPQGPYGRRGGRLILEPRKIKRSPRRKGPRKGPMETFPRNKATSNIRSGKRGSRPPPRLQPRPPREEFEVVQREVAELLKGRILVGHALHNDLKALFLGHPKKKIRDTQKYKPFRTQVKSGRPSLKLLAERILGIQVQQAEHCSVQDAQVAMRLYVLVKRDWESLAGDRRPPAPAAHSQDA